MTKKQLSPVEELRSKITPVPISDSLTKKKKEVNISLLIKLAEKIQEIDEQKQHQNTSRRSATFAF